MEISEDGLLKHPKQWGNSKFNKYGYSSKAEAIKAFDDENDFADFVIIEGISRRYKSDDE